MARKRGDKKKRRPRPTPVPTGDGNGTSPPPPPATEAKTFTAWNTTSINDYGKREITVVKSGVFANADLAREYAAALVNQLARNEQLVTMEIAETPEDPTLFAKFREGDVIGVSLANSGRYGNLLVRSRAYDATRGTMLVSGEACLNVPGREICRE